MGVFDPIKKVYYFFEDNWYNIMDGLDKHIPVYKIIDPVDKVIPSFILFLLLTLFLIILSGYLLQFSSPYEVSFVVSDSETKTAISGVKLSGTINDSIFEKITGSNGEAKVITQGLKRNFYGLIWQLMTNEKDSIAAVISATKVGYKSITKKEMELASKQAKILMEKEPAVALDANYPNSVSVTLVDEENGDIIIDTTGLAYIKFRCNNKTINPQPKTVKDGDDGAVDGKFILNETACAFVINEASAPGYESRAGLSFALPTDEEEHTVSLTRIEEPTTGNAKIFVVEANASPEKRIPGIEVTLTDDAGITTKYYSDNSGIAAFYGLTAGKYTITATSPDGNYYALTAEAKAEVTVPISDTNEVTIRLVKLNPDLVRIVKVKFVDSTDQNLPLSGVKMLLQIVSTDTNGNKFANGSIGVCTGGCISDSNGIITVTGLDANKEGKLVVSAYKEGYVHKIFTPELFKTGLGPQTVLLNRAVSSNTGEAKVFVKSKNTQKPLYGARTFLYMNSPVLSIKKIKILESGKLTDTNGRADYNSLPMGIYYANASFAGKASADSNTASIDVGEGIHQIVTLNVLIDTNVSSIKLFLYDGITREKILAPVNPQVRLYEVLDNNFSPTTLLETLSFSRADKSFTSSGYEASKKVLLTADINGYASNFITISSLANGENLHNLLLYPISSLDSNINIFFNGFYSEAADIDSLNQALFVDRNHSAYYAKIDVVLKRSINQGKLLSMLRINGPMFSEGIPYKTGFAYNTSESFSCKPSSKISGVNDDNYYFPQGISCTTGNRLQSAIKWEPQLRAGTYSFVVKLKFDENAEDNDIVTLGFRAKEDLNSTLSETALIEKSFYINKAFCNPADLDCPKIFFDIKINGTTLNSSTGLDYFTSEKSFKSKKTIPLSSKQINPLEIYLYNNSGSSITPTLNIYSYNGYWLGFKGNTSGNLHVGDSNLSPKNASFNIPQIYDKTRSSLTSTRIYPDSYNETQYLILEAVFGSEKYYTYISTKALGRALKIEAEFVAALMNQTFDGQALSSSDNTQIDLRAAKYTAYKDCGTTKERIATDNTGTALANQPLSVLDNYFVGIIPGIYAYKKDCVELVATPTSSNFDEITKRIYAGFGGAVDPSLACIDLKSPQNLAEDFSLEWNSTTKIKVTNMCKDKVSVMLESDLVVSPENAVSINSGESQEYVITGRNKTYSSEAKFSDVLGVFPVLIKAKPYSATQKKYSIADRMRIHLENQNECFIISKDLFDFTSPTNNNSFDINNACQYTLIEDYYVPKAAINSFGIDLNMYKTKKYGAVDFDWNITMTGVTYGTNYNTRTITSRGNVYQATFDPAKSEDLGDKTKYYGISIDMTKNNIDTNEIWIKWNDLYDDFNYFGASIDGNVIITLKGNGNQKYSIKPSVDYNIDSRSCECNGFSNGEPACNVSSKNYCVSGMEQDPVFEGFAYTNMHFTLPTTMEIRSFDFNLITSKNVENLSYFVTPLGTKDLQDLNIYVTNREETRSILTGDFRLYPAEGLTYILEDLGYDDATAGLTQKEMFCIQEQANKAKYIDGNIYWIEPTLLSYDFASPECSNPNKNLLGRVGKIADSNKLLRSGSGYDSAWIEKGFSAWTSKCREIDDVLRIGKKKTVCEVYEKSANDSFKLKEIDSTGYALPMCVSSAETGTYDTSSNCANIVTCTNDTVNKVCALSNSVVQNTFQDTGFLTLINPSVKVETVDVKSGTQDLPNGTMIVWVEGRFLKARFFGEDNPQYNSGNIPMLLEKTYGTGTQYSIINIKDYVNSGKTRKQ